MYSDSFETSYKQSNENLVGWKARIDEAIGTRNAGKMARQVVWLAKWCWPIVLFVKKPNKGL